MRSEEENRDVIALPTSLHCEGYDRGKFNRCITSQLIKWFSNFREFYYIQMEKFARQAINDGVTGSEELSVSRDCELFRALNMHYNKANDFECPVHLEGYSRPLDQSGMLAKHFSTVCVGVCGERKGRDRGEREMDR
ncbi:Prospero homeobox protein 1 Homeobox prospero-like protein PROX1 [Takifugu flavidus]|uniref:Prospero homeobox protein 1 Homeobox prospero-like protein PROX1 n=1 Tax=Takifugu flavidus TaxID=433684 RepID=A0A5C6NNB6_9TELE|nr:Prospero homeobox protein 1 Homeobox prospero-like protein PROX1 [Takifugu flavidus]